MNWKNLMRLEPHREKTNAQGLFRYYRSDGWEEITAINGKLYRNNFTLLYEGFQTERPIEAVQDGDNLYLATGTKLLVYDGETVEEVEPYLPDGMEYLYIGGNGLANNPTGHLTNRTSSELFIDAVIPSQRYGVVNKTMSVTVFVAKPDSMNVEYRMERSQNSWTVEYNWRTTPTFNFKTKHLGDQQLLIYVREAGETDETKWVEYQIPRYTIKETYNAEEEERHENVQACNRIVKHWNRLVLYGNPENPNRMYFSHLNTPNYFPIPNSIDFTNAQNEPINKMVRYRDMLVVFSSSSIQALFGTSPMDFRRVVLNTDVGCIAPESAKVVENHIYFLSSQGVYLLKSVGNSEDRANVQRVDDAIENLIYKDTNACAVVHDNQYHLVFPDREERFRYYYKLNAWTQDRSYNLTFQSMQNINGMLYGLQKDGSILVSDFSRWDDDDAVYEMEIETKYYDFNEPYHDKKPKELHLMVNARNFNTSIATNVLIDQQVIIDTDKSYATTDEEGNVYWQPSFDENVHLHGSTAFGGWVLGESPFGEKGTDVYKLRLRNRGRGLKVKLNHIQKAPVQVLGLGLIFKVKAP